MNYVEELKTEVCTWPGISAHAHRFGGWEFRFGKAELGHVHPEGMVDIPFPRQLRDALLRESLADEHQWAPDSGWTSFRVRARDDIAHAIWLLRLSHLRYALKTAADSRGFLEHESKELRLTAELKSLLGQLAPPGA